MRTSTSRIVTCLAVAMIALPVLDSLHPAYATRIQWCMRVVPSGELVIRYGAVWCKS